MAHRFARFFGDESGTTAIEYGLIAALVCVAIIVAMRAFGLEVQSLFTKISENVAAV
jgi:pilus assembly protein Flp/PilA